MKDKRKYRIISNGDYMATKTNAVRLVQQAGIPLREAFYAFDEQDLSGTHAADAISMPHEQVFKTLVTVGKTKTNYVFVIPVAEELDLKKAAKCVGEKSIEMIKFKELLPLTGYVHGGCSPIGMKKTFKTFVHETAKNFDTIVFSAGKIGYQVQLDVKDLEKMIRLGYGDLVI